MTDATPSAPLKPKRRLTWRRVALAFIVLTLLAEITLRAFGFSHPVLTQADDACGYFCQPNQSTTRFLAYNHINAFGMRSADVAPTKPPGTFRVFFIGDSVTYGTTSVDQSLIFTGLLQAELPAKLGSPVEVLNASAGGWAPGNEVGYLTSRGTFQSDLVILVLNSADPYQPFATFVPSINYPTARPWTALGEITTRYVLPRIFKANTADQGTSLPPDPKAELPKNLALLDKAQTFITAAGGHMAIVFSPFQNSEIPDPHAPPELVHWATDHKVPLLDTTPEFLKIPVLDATIDGMHLKPRGNRIIADQILDHWKDLTAQ